MLTLHNLSHRSENVLMGIDIVGIEESDHIPAGQCNTLVHRIVDAMIRLGDELAYAPPVPRHNILSAISGCPVHYDVLHLVMVLRGHRTQGVFNGLRAVMANRDYRKSHNIESFGSSARS